MDHRKRISVALTAAMVMVSGLPGSYAETKTGFSDIGGHWAESIIKEAASLGIAGGYLDGTFLPDNLIKREEFYKLLSNILTEKPDTANTKIEFTDVVDYEWYVPTIKTAVAAGITSGYDDGTFGIGRMISRQEAAKVAGSVISTLGTEDKKGVETAPDRKEIADWAYDYVDLMFKKGYMQGDTDGNFRPTMALTRAEAATILLNIKKNEPVIAPNAEEASAAAGCLAEHFGQEGVFLKGDGTRANPYEITNEEQLNHMRMHAAEDAFYILKKNIAITKDYAVTPPADSDETDWTGGNFVPIGSKETPFQGTLLGEGYTVSGMNISGTVGSGSDKTAAGCTGLFGYLAQGSSVTDVVVDAVNISGGRYTGGIAGYNEGTVKDCQLGKQGSISGGTYAGGLVGYNQGVISCSYSEGSVSSESLAGGIVGENRSEVSNCYNSGKVNGAGLAGGVAGRNTGTVTNVYCAGAVSGSGSIGALAGRNSGTLSNSFWLDTVGSSATGLSDSSGTLSLVSKVTHEELSGQVKIKTSEGYERLIDVMNATNANIIDKTAPDPVWEYLYTVGTPGALTIKYLYPSIKM